LVEFAQSIVVCLKVAERLINKKEVNIKRDEEERRWKNLYDAERSFEIDKMIARNFCR
jgi:hypothetical protein